MNTRSAIRFWTGTVLLLLGLAIIMLWFRVASDPSLSFEEKRTAYLSYFPSFLQKAILITLLNWGLFTAAGFLYYFAAKELQGQSIRRIIRLLMFLSMILAFWQLWSLM